MKITVKNLDNQFIDGRYYHEIVKAYNNKDNFITIEGEEIEIKKLSHSVDEIVLEMQVCVDTLSIDKK